MFLDTIAYLKQKKLHVTPARRALLLAFIEHKGVLSYRQLSTILGATFDRTTIYRTLELFLQKKIIHVLPGTSTKLHYALLRDNPGCSSRYHTNHVHFMCKLCETTMCLHSIPIPSVQLPDGFTGTDIEVVVKGICCNCQKSEG